MPIKIKMRVRVPKELLSSAKVVDEIARAQRQQTAPELKKLFKQTVDGWKTPPDFSQTQAIGPNRISISVFTSGPNAGKYALVNEGSPPHIIRPRRGGMLRFQTGYRAGTRPRMLSSRAYQRFGNYISTGIVHHPGFDARKFDETVAEEHGPQFEKDMQDAIKRAAP